jgi:uncharacterized protein (DUF433 family)
MPERIPTLAGDAPPIGQGLYSVAELRRLIGVRGDAVSIPTVARWISEGLTPSEHQRGRPSYSFHDLVSLLVVRWLRSEGVRLDDIRRAEEHLRRFVGVARPFASQRIQTDGINVLYRAEPAIIDQITAANRGGQEVLERALGESLRGIGYQDDLAAWWQIAAKVELRPEISFGEPCVQGTALRTAQVRSLAAAGEPPERIADLYEVPLDRIIAALEFENQLARSN